MKFRRNETYGNSAAEAWCLKFLASRRSDRFLLGRNKWSQSIAKIIDVAGIVDDFTQESHFQGIQIVKAEELPESAMVVSCVHGHPNTAKNRLSVVGIQNIDLFSFARWSGIAMEPVFFWNDHAFEREYEEHSRSYSNLEKILTDSESVQCLRNIINFRLSWDIAFLSGFPDRQDLQYFEPFLPRFQGLTFIDGGAFDGMSFCRFAKAFPAYHSIYAFEPIPKNVETLQTRAKDLRDVIIIPKGLHSCDATLRFSEDGISSHVSDSGDCSIQVTKIDSLKLWERGQPVFIKLDVEGEEKNAIEGATRTIRESYPILAVCVYHKVDDLRVIPETILGLRNDYRVFLRHYLEGPTETVMYFVPKSEA
ncbi:MAG: FkbM family methyltransferase [Candidatus Riflebacteria bacterium]|nr:FkbM family methyltransferase [Candidatus Riflebacteria bacterium]